MNIFTLKPHLALGRRTWLAVLLVGMYGGLVGMVPWVIGYAGDPGVELIVILQILMVPILLAAFVTTFRDNPGVVPILAVAPAILSWFLILSTQSWSRSLEYGSTVLAVGIVALAFSGSWTVLGYATGTAARWSRRETVGKRTLVRACLGVGLGSVIVYAAYLVALEALLIGGAWSIA